MVPARRTKPAPWLALPDPDVEAAALAFPPGDRRAFGVLWAEMARRMDVSERRIRAPWPLAIKRIQDAVAADTRVPRGIAPAPAPAWWWFDPFMEAVGSTL